MPVHQCLAVQITNDLFLAVFSGFRVLLQRPFWPPAQTSKAESTMQVSLCRVVQGRV
jgi:hypothetical protein